METYNIFLLFLYSWIKISNVYLSSIFQYGLSQLDASALKTRIKPWVDTFLSTSHNISEEDFSIYEANDPFIQGFIMNLEQLLNEFKVNLLQGVGA